jgi:hypothetical protein
MTREGAFAAAMIGSTETVPEKYSFGPGFAGRDPAW